MARVAALMGAFVLVAGACGGDDDGSPSSDVAETGAPAPETTTAPVETTTPEPVTDTSPDTVSTDDARVEDESAGDDGSTPDTPAGDTPAVDETVTVGPGTAVVVVDGRVRVMDVSCERLSSSFFVFGEERDGDEWRFTGSFDLDDASASFVGVQSPRAGESREAGRDVGELSDLDVGDGVAGGTGLVAFPEGDGELTLVFDLECPLDDVALPPSLQASDVVEGRGSVTLGDEVVAFGSPIPVCLVRADGRGFSIVNLPSPDADLTVSIEVARRAGEDTARISLREDTRNVLVPGGVVWQADSARRGLIADLTVSDSSDGASGTGEFEAPDSGDRIPMSFDLDCA